MDEYILSHLTDMRALGLHGKELGSPHASPGGYATVSSEFIVSALQALCFFLRLRALHADLHILYL